MTEEDVHYVHSSNRDSNYIFLSTIIDLDRKNNFGVEITLHHNKNVNDILRVVSDKTTLGSSTLMLSEDSVEPFASRMQNERDYHYPSKPKVLNRKLWGVNIPVTYNIPIEGLRSQEYEEASSLALNSIEGELKDFFSQARKSIWNNVPTGVEMTILKKGSLLTPSDERLFYMSEIVFKIKVSSRDQTADRDTYDQYYTVRVFKRPISGAYRVQRVDHARDNVESMPFSD